MSHVLALDYKLDRMAALMITEKHTQEERSVELSLGVNLNFTLVVSFLAVPVSSLSGTCVLFIQQFGGDVGSGGMEEGEAGGACVGPEPVCLQQHLPHPSPVPGELTIFRLHFPGSQISWLLAGFIQREALGGDGKKRERGKLGFSLFPSLTWVVSIAAATCLPGPQILLDRCAGVPASAW